MRTEIIVDELAEPISHYAHAVVTDNLVFVSGCTAADKNGVIQGGDDVAAQTDAVLRALRSILEEAGSGLDLVCKVTVYLTDVNDRPKINPVRQRFFGSARPASTLVEISRLAYEEAKVEIDAVATLREPA